MALKAPQLWRFNEAMIVCPFCGFENEDGALFCEQCKSDLAGVPSTTPGAGPIDAPPMATPIDAAPFEAAPIDATPIDAAPFEAAPIDATPIDAAPFEATPIDAAPIDAAPPMATPIDATPYDAAPFEAAPIDAAPIDAAPFEAAPIDAAPNAADAMEAPPIADIPAVADIPPAPPAQPAEPVAAPVEPDPAPPVPPIAPEPAAPATGPGGAFGVGTTPKLMVIRGLKINVEFPLYDGHNFIGRADEQPVDIDLEDQEPPDRVWCSRQHALIDRKEDSGTMTLEDLNSSNGTFLNRERIHPGQPRELNPDDVIQIGTVQLKVKL